MLNSFDWADDAVDDIADVVDTVVVSLIDAVNGKSVETVDGFFSFLMHLVGATSISISCTTAMLVAFVFFVLSAHFCS